MDVLWFQVAKPAGLDAREVPLGTIQAGKMLVAIDRGDYWQSARIIPKGGFDAVRAKGLDAFRADVAGLVPELASGVASLASWDDVKRSEEHTSELQSLMRRQLAVFCLK